MYALVWWRWNGHSVGEKALDMFHVPSPPLARNLPSPEENVRAFTHELWACSFLGCAVPALEYFDRKKQGKLCALHVVLCLNEYNHLEYGKPFAFFTIAWHLSSLRLRDIAAAAGWNALPRGPWPRRLGWFRLNGAKLDDESEEKWIWFWFMLRRAITSAISSIPRAVPMDNAKRCGESELRKKPPKSLLYSRIASNTVLTRWIKT